MKKIYPKDYVGLVLISCMSQYLDGEEKHKFILDVIQNGKVRKQYAINYMEKSNLEDLIIGKNRKEDIYVYNYIKFRNQIKVLDLIKIYYDLYVDFQSIEKLHKDAIDYFKSN